MTLSSSCTSSTAATVSAGYCYICRTYRFLSVCRVGGWMNYSAKTAEQTEMPFGGVRNDVISGASDQQSSKPMVALTGKV